MDAYFRTGLALFMAALFGLALSVPETAKRFLSDKDVPAEKRTVQRTTTVVEKSLEKSPVKRQSSKRYTLTEAAARSGLKKEDYLYFVTTMELMGKESQLEERNTWVYAQNHGVNFALEQALIASFELPSSSRNVKMSPRELILYTSALQKIHSGSAQWDEMTWISISSAGSSQTQFQTIRTLFDIPDDANIGSGASAQDLLASIEVILQSGGDTSDSAWWNNFDQSVREANDIPKNAMPGASAVDLFRAKSFIQSTGTNQNETNVWSSANQVIKGNMSVRQFLNSHSTGVSSQQPASGNTSNGSGASNNSGSDAGDAGSDSNAGSSTGISSGSLNSGIGGGVTAEKPTDPSGSGSGDADNGGGGAGQPTDTDSGAAPSGENNGVPNGNEDDGAAPLEPSEEVPGAVVFGTLETNPDGSKTLTITLLPAGSVDSVTWTIEVTDENGDGTYESEDGNTSISGDIEDGVYECENFGCGIENDDDSENGEESEDEDEAESEDNENEGDDNTENSDDENDGSDDDSGSEDGGDVVVGPDGCFDCPRIIVNLRAKEFTLEGVDREVAPLILVLGDESRESFGVPVFSHPGEGVIDPVEDTANNEGGDVSEERLDSPGEGIVDPAPGTEGSGGNQSPSDGRSRGSAAGGALNTAMLGAVEPWYCRRVLVKTASGNAFCYCPVSSNPQTGAPLNQFERVDEEAPDLISASTDNDNDGFLDPFGAGPDDVCN